MEDKILSISSAGIQTSDARVRALMNNMVNTKTPGFRASDVVVGAFPQVLEAAEARMGSSIPRVEGTYIDQSPGAFVRTGRRLDAAIEGDGFFVIQTSEGVGYTRDGRFHMTADGRILTMAGGYPVLGMGGPLVVTPGAEIEISQLGEVKINGSVVDELQIAFFDRPDKLDVLTGSIFQQTSGMQMIDGTPRVRQGYVEGSNVNLVAEMANLIYLNRAYGINTKLIQTRDALLSRSLEMGRVTQ